MFILQILSVCWTKRSRAAPLAGIRNRLPRALPLPDTVLDCELWGGVSFVIEW